MKVYVRGEEQMTAFSTSPTIKFLLSLLWGLLGDPRLSASSAVL